MDKKNYATLGRYIFNKRRWKRKSQAELAMYLGISRVTLSHIENDKVKPRVDVAHKLSVFLGVPFSIYYYYEELELKKLTENLSG